MKKKVISGVLILGIGIIIIPMLYYCMLSLPFSDDFALARKTGEYLLYHNNSYFISALANTKDAWLKWQGTYTGCFSAVFFNMFYRWGLLGLRLLNTIITLLFFASLFYLTRVFCKKISKPLTLTLWVYLIILFCITNNCMYSEIYTWYTGIVVYLIPCVFLLIEMSMCIEYMRNQGNEWIIAAICGVLAGGGVINMATLACGLCLIITAYGLFQLDIKDKIKACIPLASTVAGTLLNVMAPGNYARWEEKGELSVIRVAGSSIMYVFRRIGELSSGRMFILLLIALFIVVYKYGTFDYKGKMTFRHPYALLPLIILGCATVNFPYCLGLRVQSMDFYFENRALFVEDLSIYLLFSAWVFYYVGYIKYKYKQIEFNRENTSIILVLYLSFVLVIYGSGLYSEYTTPYMIEGIADGSIREYAQYQESIIDWIENNTDKEIDVKYNIGRYAPSNYMIIGMSLSDDPNRWDYYNNETIAEYYGKDRVDVEYVYVDE